MKSILFIFLIIFSLPGLTEDSLPSGDAAQETIVHHQTHAAANGVGNIGASCTHTTTGCAGIDCQSCGGCLTPENSKKNSEDSAITR